MDDAEFKTAVLARFDRIDIRFDALDRRLDAMESRFDRIDARMNAFHTRIDEQETATGDLSRKIDMAQKDLQKDLSAKIGILQTEINGKTENLQRSVIRMAEASE